MPSQLHETLLLLFRNRPTLAPELLRDALNLTLPPFGEVRMHSADLSDLQPAEYRADLVLVLNGGALDSKPSLGIIVEIQLSPDSRKRFVWPVYAANLRARLECPVCLLVVAANEAVAKWAAQPVDMGGGNHFTPLVLAPSVVPEVTDVSQACSDPELAVLSAIAHGHDADVGTSVRIAVAAQKAAAGLDEDRSKLYHDVVVYCLNEGARTALKNMTAYTKEFLKTYEYKSDFARHFIAEGRVLGVTEGEQRGEHRGRVAMVTTLLATRFGPLSIEVHDHLHTTSIGELDAIAKRTLTATSLQEALGQM